MAAQIRHSMPPLKESNVRRTSIISSEICQRRKESSEVSQTNEARCDSSPYSTVNQVIPGGHVEETIQGELMRENLESGLTVGG